MHRFALEEKHIREENLRLQRKLQQEVRYEHHSHYIQSNITNTQGS